jgi:hypothetical protein
MLLAIVILFVFGGIAGMIGAANPSDESALPMGVVGMIGAAICVVIVILSAPGLIAGIGLLRFRPWGRILGIVISALDLVSVPIGTALGVYGLWVLLSNETEALFRTPGQYVNVRPY